MRLFYFFLLLRFAKVNKYKKKMIKKNVMLFILRFNENYFIYNKKNFDQMYVKKHIVMCLTRVDVQ